MNLPVRIQTEPATEPVIRVDGISGPQHGGLDLSHWPGHATPTELRHDLSTGSALLFARLEAGERERLAAGATAIVNNHYDSDGCLALFAVRHPEKALIQRERMLATAAAGDFFRSPDDQALVLDALVVGLTDREVSPLRADFAGASDVERWQCCVDHLLEAFPTLLAGDVGSYRELWEPVLERHQADRAALGQARREDAPALDLSVWSSPSTDFAPGRHAVFGASPCDRALTFALGSDGARVRLVLSTSSWFDLVSEKRLPRPDLVPLAAALNALEGTDDADEHAWRAQPLRNASPELWFGRTELPPFAEHNDALAPSALDPVRVRTEIERALG